MAHAVDSNWSLGASTGSLGSTASTPRLCTHRGLYRGSGGASAEIMSPQQPSPCMDSAGESPTTSWSPKERDRHNQNVVVAHIRLRPEIKADLPSAVPSSAREPSQGYSASHHHHRDPANHRSVNEELDKYMVIRQRSFHGYARSKQDLRQLPQTDPREEMDAVPSWLHRSKTDIYIERRRAKLATQRARRRGGSGGYNLDGITLGSLVDQLPVPGKRDHNGNAKLESRNSNLSPGESPGETRFPPLTLNRMKQMIQNDIQMYSLESQSVDRRRPSTTNALPTSSTTFPVPDPPPNSPPPPAQETTGHKRGRLRKQPLGSIPLRIWEPSLDYVLRSSAKELQPRQALSSLAHQAAVRQQPSPLK
ncbi:uncharacterized protein LOC110979748 [Acanthaster planci]|uniref:Uncharacterized protein LOC110979748 n=1 Tax=Acanthaster planci TaxID=133434 RepID=A0A8B7YGG7_ACAPL|nr:uncharacterized protein LOC110979748 [Acanthaster planci]